MNIQPTTRELQSRPIDRDQNEASRIAELDRIDAEITAVARRLGISRDALIALMAEGTTAPPSLGRLEFLA